MTMNIQQILGPFDLMSRLKAPGAIDVGGVVLVVVLG